MPRIESIKKVLLIGSGPIVIGQAAEFDYAGTQACKALREEGVTSVLINSNPATIMTDEGVADITYIEPLTVDVIARIIERERPDGVLGTLGGQTGLNLSVKLDEAGVLERYGTRLLGTPVTAIQTAEDREAFKQLLLRIGEPVPPSRSVNALDDALDFAAEIGLPLVVRPAFTLGGSGGGVAWSMDELRTIAQRGLDLSPIHQVLVEQYLRGWKELEYEVIRDAGDTCITVCNMENLDPLGIHTGDSIVVAPSQTLTDREYQMLRGASIHIIRALGVEGGCNVQFALDPKSEQYYVIEVNPRVSRSSALASKATGYPIARVATKVALGYRLHEITNAVTGRTSAAFEPALDYVVVKIPRWPFDKFPGADRSLGTQMKATGEVMAIDRTFEAALQKAMRSLEMKPEANKFGLPLNLTPGQVADQFASSGIRRAVNVADHNETITHDHTIIDATDARLWRLFGTLREDSSDDALEALHQETGIDHWFLAKIRRIVRMEALLAAHKDALDPDLLRRAKRMGFADAQIALATGQEESAIRQLRMAWDIRPVYKMVDTCAGEFAAQTPYYYSTYEQENEAPPLPTPKAVVIGSGPIRIGQGIEFDYCSVRSATALREAHVASIMINSNPETVSTDFDMSDRLYFEPLDAESVMNVLANEGGEILPPVIVQFGGQTAINLADKLAKRGVPILGTPADAIDLAEDRERFDALMEELQIPRPRGAAVRTIAQALRAADAIGYPVMVRPSFVLGGRAMEIVRTPETLRRYVERALSDYGEHPLLIDRYLVGREVEVDAICDGTDVLIPGIMRHIERAGVHSGDSFAVYPALGLSAAEVDTIVAYTTQMSLAMQVRGLMNIQFVVTEPAFAATSDDGAGPANVYVIEANPRASRTVPFLSKVTGVPMVTLATRIMLGESLRAQGYQGGLWPRQPLVAIKAPVFSMAKILGAEAALGPEMKSTGEVMGVDYDYTPALIKAFMAAGIMLPKHGAAFASIADRDKAEALPILQRLADHGYTFYATPGTARLLTEHGMIAEAVNRIGVGQSPIPELIRSRQVNIVINTITGGSPKIREGVEIQDGFLIRRNAVEAGIPCFTSLDTAAAAIDLLDAAPEFAVLPIGEYRQGIKTEVGVG
jgi:carbamoyl-phosphate synthase large subunit